ncbi:MAG: VIT domain-containing protein [Acidobacteriota bacterium]
MNIERRKFYSLVCKSAVLLLLLMAAESARAQSGVLIPSSADKPDPKILTLDEMSVHIVIDNQFARVRVVQIFGNHTDRAEEGKYVFLIPTTAAIADFAIWDGDVRIPGVIMEKRRAEEIYKDLALQAIDPGLVQQADEDEGATAFTVKVAPIPAYGTKRLEMEYTELLRVENLESYFSFPFKPSQYGTQTVGRLDVRLQVLSKFPLTDLKFKGNAFPLNWIDNTATYKSASFAASNKELTEDFAFSYGLNVPRTTLEFLAYRAPERISADDLRDPRLAQENPDGYFEAAALFNEAGRAPGDATPPPPRSVLVMLDTSLSMNWEKLDKSYEAVESVLKSLLPQDSFNLILFNDDILAFSDKAVDARPEAIERALQFIKSSFLSGGTDFNAALARTTQLIKTMPAKSESAVVLISDGNPTMTTTKTSSVIENFKKANESVKTRLYVFGIGSDSDVFLLQELARASRGYFDWSRETDDLEFKLKSFVSKVGRNPIDSLALQNSDSANFYQVYPDYAVTAYDGTRLSFVGRYRRPGATQLVLTGNSNGKAVRLTEQVQLPERNDEHPHIARLWARARVDALLRQIALTGETQEAINEIIALSKKYKFVTPYTSFLAAPRSLLRPRVIRPGDPVLRVRTDEAIKEVTAVFPFGLTKRLMYLKGEDVWETRFIAPKEMKDGAYTCRLILLDKQGRAYQESKSFIIDSRPPSVKATVDKAVVNAGDELTITARADSDTRRIAARIYGALPVAIVWDGKAKASIGRLQIPEGLPSGTYTIEITAEDFAHNSSVTEVTIEVMSGG